MPSPKLNQPYSVVTVSSQIASTLSISEPYATRIRNSQCTPHPRHWLALSRLVVPQVDKIDLLQWDPFTAKFFGRNFIVSPPW